jgi:hypothetical protein
VEETLAGEDSGILDRYNPEYRSLAQVWRTTEEDSIGQGKSGNRRDQRGYTAYFWYD